MLPVLTYVDVEKSMDFFFGKVQGSLVVCPTGIDDHAVQSSGLLNDTINSSGDSGLLCYIGLNGLYLAWPSLLRGCELFARLGIIDRVDKGGAVVKARFGDSEANATIGTGDYQEALVSK